MQIIVLEKSDVEVEFCTKLFCRKSLAIFQEGDPERRFCTIWLLNMSHCRGTLFSLQKLQHTSCNKINIYPSGWTFIQIQSQSLIRFYLF